MITFDGNPFPQDYLFFRTAGNVEILTMPLCEAFIAVNGVIFDPKLTSESTIAFIQREENGKTFKYNREEFRQRLSQDIYDGNKKVTDFIIQPEAEQLTAEVSAFLERYNY